MEYRQFTTNESVVLDRARAAISNNNIYSTEFKREALANLDALACAEIRCGAGVSDNDPRHRELSTLQARGEQLKQDHQTDIYAKLRELGVDSTEEKTVRRGRDQYTRQEPLFGYSLWDASDDFIGSNEQISARVQQVAVGAGGSAEATLGVAVTTAGCATVAGCAVAGPLGAWLAADGADTAYKASEALNSDYVYVNGTRVLNSFSEATHQEAVRPTVALLTNVGVNAAGGVIAKKAGALVLRDELPAVPKADIVVNKPHSGSFDYNLSQAEPPKGKVYEGAAHRYERPEYVETSWDQHSGNINADHRYTRQGQGGVYAGTSQETALNEITHYDPNAQDVRVAITKEVKLDNVLDLTDSQVRKKLNVTLDDITNGIDYSKTQKIGG